MMYLIRTVSADWKYQDDIDKYPTGYPGGIGEAVEKMDIWDSAVDMLVKRGMVDPTKVGIIGFSRTGWEVEYDLVHARTHYAAATAADNVQYSLSDYWLFPWLREDSDHLYGGPPYGKTLRNWQQYSISFNLDKVHTPLLIERMGYGTHEDLPFTGRNSLPGNLAVVYELTTGLSQLGKPFELYYYPDEQHQPQHPKARLASLQRNLDWYRFWLQGYEDPSPAKRSQYIRWRHLKVLCDTDATSEKGANRNTTGR